jgi:hypothetical protein
MNTTNQYLMLVSDNGWYNHVSAEELQAALDKFGAWFEEQNQKGIAGPSAPLVREGAIITSKGGRVTVADGPFAESKEAIGGFFTLNVGSMEEAIAVAKGCPITEYGGTIEVRPIAAECPLMSRVREMTGEPALAAA